MQIDKAIELLNDLEHWSPELMKTDAGSAIRLGREALLRIKRQRLLTIPINQPLLPGEEQF